PFTVERTQFQSIATRHVIEIRFGQTRLVGCQFTDCQALGALFGVTYSGTYALQDCRFCNVSMPYFQGGWTDLGGNSFNSCPALPELALSTATGSCTSLQQVVTVDARLRNVTNPVVAGQMLLSWDPAKLAFESVLGGDGPFNVVYSLNRSSGQVIVLTSVAPGSSGGSVVDNSVAKMQFRVIGATCGGTGNEVSFLSAGPLQTAFTDGLGNVIVPALTGSAGFVVDDGVPVLSNVPADVSVRPEAGEGTFAMVSLTAPTATDGCSPVTQTATRSDGQALSAAYGVGTTTVTWRAVDPCGNEAVDFTSVTVEPFNTLDLSVSLAGGGFAPSLNRDLQLSVQGAGGTQARSVSALFSTGTASVSLTDLPIDAYGCITVEDTARSLRRRVNVTDGGATWTATASLVLGDIIDDEVIDVLDWGAYVVSNPNADLDGDGVITAADGQFILDNFGVQGDGVCGSPLDGPPTARESVSVAELVQMGLPELAGADLNGDGWLDLRDMAMAD
ncbi:MAG: hypothetical protein RLZZ558_519, partial [Planctomycetota bacterium]